MPGGVPGIRAMVDELHRAGVKALWPYNPWDTGTSRLGAPVHPKHHTYSFQQATICLVQAT